MASIEQILDRVVATEGGYVNLPSDLGGPTIWGITERVARANGYQGDMRRMPRETALRIYRVVYVMLPGFAEVHDVSAAIAEEMIDSGVNMGVSWPALWLQRALNAFNAQGALYPDLKVDGALGPRSIAALREYLRRRGPQAERVMLRALNCLQGERYLSITEVRMANEDFTFGWFAHRVVI